MSRKFLIIQTAFPGDVILATALVESLHQAEPGAQLDFLVRKGNEAILENNPNISNILILDKKNKKISNLLKLTGQIRREKYDVLINVHRFASSGFLTAFSGAKERVGFDKNPFSFVFDKKIKHDLKSGKHETERNQELIQHISGTRLSRPALYPSAADRGFVLQFKKNPFICVAPGSVWFTKTFPAEQWTSFIRRYLEINKDSNVYLLGAASEHALGESILSGVSSDRIFNLAGKLSMLQSAAMMQDAQMNYTNDSAPTHMASAMNAPVTVIFCSTIPAFGFGPLSDKSRIVETTVTLTCKPCGLHGLSACPMGHFRCATTIITEQLLS